MIVCSCNVVRHCEIERVVEEMFREDPNVVLTPGKVYKAVGCRPKCATCLLHIGKLMHEHRESLQKQSQEATSKQNTRSEQPALRKGEPQDRRQARTTRLKVRRTTRVTIYSSV